MTDIKKAHCAADVCEKLLLDWKNGYGGINLFTLQMVDTESHHSHLLWRGTDVRYIRPCTKTPLKETSRSKTYSNGDYIERAAITSFDVRKTEKVGNISYDDVEYCESQLRGWENSTSGAANIATGWWKMHVERVKMADKM